jgi:hypothetical protein
MSEERERLMKEHVRWANVAHHAAEAARSLSAAASLAEPDGVVLGDGWSGAPTLDDAITLALQIEEEALNRAHLAYIGSYVKLVQEKSK